MLQILPGVQQSLPPAAAAPLVRAPRHALPSQGARAEVPRLAVALAAVGLVQKRRRGDQRVLPGQVSPARPVPESICRPPYLAPGSPQKPTDGFPEHQFDFRGEIEERKVEVKSAEQIEGMRAACKLARQTLELAGRAVKPGVTTDDIDRIAHDYIVSQGAYPSPLGYMGFPKAICTSVNDVVGHGIPDSRRLEDGDVINIDVTVYLNGFHGDTSSMFFAGRPTKSAAVLCRNTQKAMAAGIKVCGPGVDFREIGKAISQVAEESNCYVHPEISGHGIGTYFHGCPHVVHCVNPFDQGVMQPGMTFTIEPVFLERKEMVREDLVDGWTMRSNGAWSAQFEHTILVTEKG